MKTLLLLLCSAHIALSVFRLNKLSWLKIPMDEDWTSYGLFSGAAEESAFDPKNNAMYVIGDGTNVLHIIDISVPTHPQKLFAQAIDPNREGRVLDVEVCGDIFAMSFKGRYEANDGHVEIFHTYKRNDPGLTQIGLTLPVGTYPDNMKFTSDCLKLIVANEGRPGFDGPLDDPLTKFLDPEGTVSIIDLTTPTPAISTIGFQAYNDHDSMEFFTETEYGRYAWKGNHSIPDQVNTLSQDLEPEYVTISDDNRYAFVSIQENNAMAKIDITQTRLLWLRGLGFKDWANYDIDASDRDNSISRRKYNTRSFYMPDTIRYVVLDSRGFIITLDEGAQKSLKHVGIDWDDSERARTLFNMGAVDLAEMDPNVLAAVQTDAELGRLYLGKEDGRAQFTPLLATAYHFGGRGWSMWEDRDLVPITHEYESGSSIEQLLEQYYPAVFNCKATNRNNRPDQESDIRSPHSGPELNGLAYGQARNSANTDENVLFLGDQNSNAIFGYTFSGTVPVFQSVQRAGLITASWNNLYNNGDQIGDAGISDMGLIRADESPTGNALVYVLAAQSGSLALYEVVDN